jgi:hypothetical protein
MDMTFYRRRLVDHFNSRNLNSYEKEVKRKKKPGKENTITYN